MVMSMRVAERVQELATKIMQRAEPGILSVGDLSTLVEEELGLCRTTARRYVRLAIDDGRFIELRPGDKWRVTWPDAQKAHIGAIRLCAEIYQVDERHMASRLYLAHDAQGGRTRKVNPGITTYVMLAEHGRHFIRSIKDLSLTGRALQ